MIKKIHINKEHFSSLAQGGIGGILSGISLLNGVSFLMPFSISLLWSSSKVPLSGFLWGFIAVLFSHKWILSLHPLNWIGISAYLSLPISIFIWTLCGILGGVLVFFWSWLFNRRVQMVCYNENSFYLKFLFAIIFSVLWGLAEVFLSHGPFFWIGIGGSLLPGDRWLAGWARIFGEGGLAVIQLLIGWWIWQLKIIFSRRNEFSKLFIYGLIILFLGHLLGWSFIKSENTSDSINVALWQSNVPIRDKYSSEELIRLPKKINLALKKAKELEASTMVAPEGTLPLNSKLSEPSLVNFLAGGFRLVDGNQRSSLLAINVGERDFSEALDKFRLVPLGEWSPKVISSLTSVGGLQPGDSSRLFEWQGPPLVGAICYEISDGSSIAKATFDGGEWILSIANLDPYPLALQKQFISLAQLRSIESNRYLAIASNTGPTSLIKNTGKVEFTLRPFQEELVLTKVALSKKKTFYSCFRELPLVIFLIVTFFLLLLIKHL